MDFQDLSLSKALLRGLEEAGYQEATPIQLKAIPEVLKGRDLIGCAQTGTGKTAAFAVPTMQRLVESATATATGKRQDRSNRRAIRCLILAPTRELAGQIAESFGTYGKFTDLRHTVIFGGVGQGNQVRAIDRGVDILVATPGRLLDLIGQGYIDLGYVEVLILDEADQMLDMGFIHDLRKIVKKCPKKRQTLMFSATMPPEIRKLSQEWLNKPFELHVAPVASTPELVTQTIYFVEKKQKLSALVHLLQETARSRTLVFSRTKWGADRIAKALNREGIKATAIHGNKSQNRRQAAIQEFKSEEPPVLVATDIAARGLDFDDISHVINFDLPDTSETYVHRIGRTARAGAKGAAISLCDSEERKRVRGIEQLTGCKIAVKNLPQFPQTSEPDDERRSRNGASSSWRGSASVNRTGGVRQGKKKSFTRPKKVGIHGETLRDESGDGAAVAKPAKKKTKHKSYQQKRAFNNGSDENNGGGSSNGATPTHKKRTFKKRTGGTTTPSLDDRNGSEKTAKKKPAQKNTIKKGSPTTGAPKKGSFKKSSKKPTGNGGGSTGNRPPGKRTERR